VIYAHCFFEPDKTRRIANLQAAVPKFLVSSSTCFSTFEAFGSMLFCRFQFSILGIFRLVSLLLKCSVECYFVVFSFLFWVFSLTCFSSFEAFDLNLFCRQIILHKFCRLTLPILGLAEADKGGTPGRLLLPLVSFLLSSINFFSKLTLQGGKVSP
jgi:hypothetical protein